MIGRKIINTYDACMYGWKTGDFTEADNLAELNKRVFREFFAGLVIGVYDAVVVHDGKYSAHVFTRSARAGVPVQETAFCLLPSGEWVATYHHDMKSGDDAEAGPGRVYIYEAGEDVPELDNIA
jgi:hypothetical protein